MQQFAYTTGKNATDGAMIIDAMDLLYTSRFSAFCLVSSDSDFTRLAARIREQGVTVYGFGERKTPKPFISACDHFTYFDMLPVPPAREGAFPDVVQTQPSDISNTPVDVGRAVPVKRSHSDLATEEPAETGHRRLNRGDHATYQNEIGKPVLAEASIGNSSRRPLDRAVIDGLRQAVISTAGDDGWANLADAGSFMRRISPDLNARNYGYARLRGLVEASGIVEIRLKELTSGPPVVLVRLSNNSY
jgi:hypothetical protein